MPASTKKVTKVPAKRRPTMAALEKGVAKVRAANAAKAARKETALLTKLMNKPFEDAGNAKPLTLDGKVVLPAGKAKREPVTALGAIRAEIADKAASKAAKAGKAKPAATKPAKVAKAATASEKPAATGAKAKILDMIAREKGTSAAEVCKALGWVRAGATIGRAIKLATFKVRKERDADGVLRYYAA